MTNKQRAEMQARKRAGYARRLRQIREAKGLPRLTNRQREALLDALMRVAGDAVTDPDMLVLHRLATRGLCG